MALYSALGMETIDACLQLLYVHREPAMKRRILEFVLANADELERRPTWNEQPFIEQLNADCCELLENARRSRGQNRASSFVFEALNRFILAHSINNIFCTFSFNTLNCSSCPKTLATIKLSGLLRN